MLPIMHFILDFTFLMFVFAQATSSITIQQKTWTWRGHSIAFDYAQSANSDETTRIDKKTILLLNGFGVGSFHQHRLISELIEQDSSCTIYAVDYLGQGKSWPVDCQDGLSPQEQGLQYSADTWLEQLEEFIHVVVKASPHVVGNSVGGHLAVALAHRGIPLSSLVLLNATPVWGLNLPGWSGRLPSPKLPKIIGRKLFDWIRDLATIEKYLDNAYFHRMAFEGELPQQIQSCTQGKGAHVAFSSIMWSPPATGKDWFTQVSELPCDCLVIFGAKDPWCTPTIAKKILEKLPKDIAKRYLELDRVGHCPNHEAPKAVAAAVTTWMNARDKRTVPFGNQIFSEPWGDITMSEKKSEDIQINLLDWFAANFVF